MSSYPPPTQGNDIRFNPANFQTLLDGLTIADGDRRYLKISGGSITGSLSIGGTLSVGSISLSGSLSANSLNVSGLADVGSLSISGSVVGSSAAQFNYVNTTAGVATASKALVLDSSKNIGTINQLTASTINVATNNPFTITGSSNGLNSATLEITSSVGWASESIGINSASSATYSNFLFYHNNLYHGHTFSLSANNTQTAAQGRYMIRSNGSALSITTRGSSYASSDLFLHNNVGTVSCGSNVLINSNHRFQCFGSLYIGSTAGTNTNLANEPSLLIENPAHVNTGAGSGLKTYIRIGQTDSANSEWRINTFRTLVSATNYLQIQGTNNIYGISVGAAGGLTVNGAGGTGAFIDAGGSTAQLGTLHVNGSLSRTVPSGWSLTPTGTASIAGGTVPISIYSGSNIWIVGNVYTTSDERLKTNIEDIELIEAKKLLKVRTVRYNWKSDSNNEKKQVGLIAQDLLKHKLDEFVGVVPNNELEDKFSLVVNYDKINMFLIELIKDLYNEVEALKAKILRTSGRHRLL